MNTYVYLVTQTVKVQAFTEADAFEALQEVYGIGENCGTVVTDCEYSDLGVE